VRHRPAKLAAVFTATLIALTPFSAAGRPGGVTVFAAASLAGTLDEVADAFALETGIVVTVSYAGTSSLARQIEFGAPADIFVSADVAWMDYLEDGGFIVLESRIDLLGNQLVLVAPAENMPTADANVAALILGGVGPSKLLAMANVEAVPAGRYCKAALETLGIWAEVAPFVAQTDNVRTALAFVARGEAPLGIVYATDAVAEPRVAIVATFDPSLHPAIIYPAAIVAGASDAEAAAFFAYLAGPEAGAVFAARGFLRPGAE